MPGQGKYSNYSDTIPDQNKGGTSKSKLDLLKNLFKGGPDIDKKSVLQRAKDFLTPGKQDPDPGLFPGGVDMLYGNAPNLEDVKWKNPGDPSTPYTPDVRSPGSAVPVDQLGNVDTSAVSTNLNPQSSDPGVAPGDFSHTIVGTDTTRSPDVFSKKISANDVENVPTGMGELYKK